MKLFINNFIISTLNYFLKIISKKYSKILIQNGIQFALSSHKNHKIDNVDIDPELANQMLELINISNTNNYRLDTMGNLIK